MNVCALDIWQPVRRRGQAGVRSSSDSLVRGALPAPGLILKNAYEVLGDESQAREEDIASLEVITPETIAEVARASSLRSTRAQRGR